jgi:hypothetical protein
VIYEPGDLVGFPPASEWSSVEAMLEVLDGCRRLVADGGTVADVDAYWHVQHELRGAS